MGASPPLKTAANRTLRLSMSACVMGLLTLDAAASGDTGVAAQGWLKVSMW